MERGGCVYMLTNKHKTTLYVGVTTDLYSRLYEHRSGNNKESFSYRYNLHYLIYYECLGSIEEAIIREKEIKKWSRKKKNDLIKMINPEWKDLSEHIDP